MLDTNQQMAVADDVAKKIYNASGISVPTREIWRFIYCGEVSRAKLRADLKIILEFKMLSAPLKGTKSNPLRFKDVARRVKKTG